MNHDSNTPTIVDWHMMFDLFRSRCKSQDERVHLESIFESQFMTAQAVAHKVSRGSQFCRQTARELLEDLQQELRPVTRVRQIRFQYDSFGEHQGRPFNECDLLGLFAMSADLVTLVSPGSTVELSMGRTHDGVELEIGSDCHSLENSRLSQLSGFQYLQRVLPVADYMDLKCPLGGAAMMINLNHQHNQQRIA